MHSVLMVSKNKGTFRCMGRSSVSVAAVTVGRQLFQLSQALAGAVSGILAGAFLCAASPDPIDQTPN